MTARYSVTVADEDGVVLDTFEVEVPQVDGDGHQAKLVITSLAASIKAGVV